MKAADPLHLTTLWLDMDAYFASAEQHLNPPLRGRPVAVVPVFHRSGRRPAENSCCIAVSYEARPSGVRTGTSVHEARRLCPSLRFVHARPAQYVQLHHDIISTIDLALPVDHAYSIDEFACRLLGSERDPAYANNLGLKIKRLMRSRFSNALSCSIGIAPNRLLAKVAADSHKPNGLSIVQSAMLPACMFDLALDDWPGISRGMMTRFARHGITTTKGMYGLDESEMASVFGSVDGRRWWMLIRGIDLPDKKTARRTLGHQHVLPPDKRNREQARRVLVRLLAKAAQRMRREGYRAGELVCAARLLPQGQWSRRTILPPTNSTRVFLAAMAEQWSTAPRARYLVVATTLQHLTPMNYAPDPLFADEQAEERLDLAIDTINTRFGYAAIRPASADMAAAPMRIPFSSVPDLTMPDLHA